MKTIRKKRWTQEEIDYIKDKPGGVTDTQLAIDLGRTIESVRMKRMFIAKGNTSMKGKSKITPGKHRYLRWDEDELKLISDSNKSDQELAKELGRSANSIRVKRYQLEQEKK